MEARDVEKNVPLDYFVATLRRLADALEQGNPFRIQVQGKRLVVPGVPRLVVEHETNGNETELSLELQWTRSPDAEE